MTQPESSIDRIMARIRANPVVALLLVLSSLVIALSSFTDAARNLLALLPQPDSARIEGAWQATVVYDWDNARYDEQFDFKVEAGEVRGTASFLGAKRAIVEGVLEGSKLKFHTRTRQTLNGENERESTHQYRGEFIDEQIHFTMLTVGGYTDHLPIEFTARRRAIEQRKGP